MKKVLYVIAVAAATIFAAGCAREQAASVAAGQDAANVTFTVSAPGIATKAISDGKSATQLTFAVYDDAGNYLKELSENAATVTGANPTWTVTVPVVQQLTYQFVFIAKAATSPYAVDLANKKVTATYGAANDDAADFFYAALKETVGSDLNKSVELVRPLAQVNVGAADLVAAAYSLDVENMTTGLKLTGINNVLNILDGTVSGSADITLAEATRVKEDTKFVDGFDRIAMGYVLVGEKQTTNATINITAKGKIDGADKVVVRDVPNVPIQANYRTNILGNIFTSNMTFNVVVEPGFDAPGYNEQAGMTIAKANAAFAEGQTSVTIDTDPATAGDGVTTITLPATTEPVRVRLNITTSETITIQYAASGEKPATLDLYALNVGGVTADLQSTTVTVSAGSHIITGDFATAPTTLIIEKTAVIDNLTVRAGSVKIYGTVTNPITTTGSSKIEYANEVSTATDMTDLLTKSNNLASTTANAGTLVIEITQDFDGSAYGAVDLNSYSATGVDNIIINGNGHVISNLANPLINHNWTGKKIEINDLTIKDPAINIADAGSNGVGAFFGYINCNEETIFNNCHVIGGSVKGGHWTGGIYGYAAGYSGNDGPVFLTVTLNDCSVEGVTIEGPGSTGALAGHAMGDAWTKVVANNFVAKDNAVKTTANESPRSGYLFGTISAAGEEKTVAGVTHTGGAYVNNVTLSGNTAATYNTACYNYYGRLVSPGKFYVDGVLYDGFAIGVKKQTTDTSIDYTVEQDAEVALEVIISDANASPKETVNIDITGVNIEWTTGGGHDSTPVVPESNTVTKEVVIDGGGSGAFVATGAGVGEVRATNRDSKLVFKNMVIEDHSASYAENSWEFAYLEFSGKVDFIDCQIKSGLSLDTADGLSSPEDNVFTFTNCIFITEQEPTSWNPTPSNMYNVWMNGGITATFTDCDFAGPYRGPKIHDQYSTYSDGWQGTVVFDGCSFHDLSKKPGVALGKIKEDPSLAHISIKNCSFINCQAGDQGLYAYESDTDVTKFDFVFENNNVKSTATLDGGVEKVVENGVATYTVPEASGLATALGDVASSGATEATIELAATTYDMKGKSLSGVSEVSFVGEGENTILDFGNGDNYATNTGVEFKNVTIKKTGVDYVGFKHSASECYENVHFEGTLWTYAPQVSFKNCSFLVDSADSYNVRIYGGATVDIQDCEFVCEGKSILVYNEDASTVFDVTVNNSSLTANNPKSGKAAIELHAELLSAGKFYKATITNNIIKGFAEGSESGNTIYNWTAASAGKLDVTENGNTVL